MTMPNFQPESEVGLSDRVVHVDFERKFKGMPLQAGRQFDIVADRGADQRLRAQRVSAPPKRRRARVIDYVELHRSEDVRVNASMVAASLSRARFAAQTCICVGCSLEDFSLFRKIESAKRFLSGASGELLTVALAAGFPIHAHFSTASRRFVGPAPGTWSHIQAEENRWRATPETMQVITRFTYGY